MKTLYNTQTEKLEGKPFEGSFSSIYNSGLNETLGWLPEYVVQLAIVDNLPTYDPSIETVSSARIVDLPNLEYKWVHTIAPKTNEQIIGELNQQAEQIEQQVKEEELAKLVEGKVIQVRTSIVALTDGEAIDYRTKFKPYKVPMTLTVGDRFYYPMNDKLYKVIGPEGTEHITQLDWKPDSAVSLYVEVTPPGVIAAWKQPAGGHDAYQIGDKVTHSGFTWESTANANVWEPGIYGWTKL